MEQSGDPNVEAPSKIENTTTSDQKVVHQKINLVFFFHQVTFINISDYITIQNQIFIEQK